LEVVGGDEATERWSALSHTEAALADRIPLGADRFHGGFGLAGGDDEAFGPGRSYRSQPWLSGRGGVQVLEAWTGGGIEALWEKTLERKKPRRASAIGVGQLASIANGLARGTKLRSR
jgi:hypothetical protein